MSTNTNHDPDDRRATAPRRSSRVSAQEVIEFVVQQKEIADSDVEIDFEALARLDDMPEDEAVALIETTMTRLLFS